MNVIESMVTQALNSEPVITTKKRNHYRPSNRPRPGNYKVQKMLNENINEIKDFLADGYKLVEIARNYEIHVQTLRKFLQHRGLYTPERKIYSEKLKREVVNELEKGKPQHLIAKEYGVSEASVRHWGRCYFRREEWN